ncbi:AMIN-like domain-containing (lipo)protein [Phytohabitans kaempferiae]|uniref:AMIN-like domain-containing protein n=1 Tax=Phytohabitans kaempferiae TaxID=1620943 RepID=A0ABV6M443_9ACTN
MWIKYPLALACLALPLVVATGAGAGATDLPAPTRTDPVVGTATVPPDRPVLVGVRHGRHDRYDRVVFDFAGGTPAYRVEYAPLVGIGTGDPIALAGAADLRVTFAGAPSTTLDMRTVLDPRYPTLRQVRFGGAFEGRILAGLGLADRLGFRVLRLADPPRIAVDVAHPPAAPFGTETFRGGGGAGLVSIAGVRSGAHPGYDRLVLDLRTAAHPLVTVAYTRPAPNRVHIGLTGLTTAPARITGPRQIHIGLSRLRGVSVVAYENGTVSVFADTNRRTGFRVMLLTNPTRVVVDVRH